jgi:hypothetical protein
VPGENTKQHHTEAVDVRASVDGFGENLFRRQVLSGAENEVHAAPA